jgi:hypothetical protein
LRVMFLALHIVGGTTALVLGVLTAYVWAVFATCLTAAVVSLLDLSRLWWLLPIAVLSYLLALVGYMAVRRGWPKWVGSLEIAQCNRPGGPRRTGAGTATCICAHQVGLDWSS